MDIVATITALAALVTSLASLFMILEMKRQRTATSKPILKVLTKSRSATVKNESKTWLWDDNEASHFTKLRLVNFGTGPALNVGVEWDIELESLVSVLKFFDPYNQFDIGHENGWIKLDNSFHAIHNQQSARIDAVPVNKVSDSEFLNIPSYYLSAFEKYVELGLLSRPKNDANTAKTIELPDFPEIYANLKYEEINGTKMMQKFRMLLSIISVSPVEGTEEKKVSAEFKVEEVSV